MGLPEQPVDIINRNQRSLPSQRGAASWKRQVRINAEGGALCNRRDDGTEGQVYGGVKKWPGPLNRVIKCRHFKQRFNLKRPVNYTRFEPRGNSWGPFLRTDALSSSVYCFFMTELKSYES